MTIHLRSIHSSQKSSRSLTEKLNRADSMKVLRKKLKGADSMKASRKKHDGADSMKVVLRKLDRADSIIKFCAENLKGNPSMKAWVNVTITSVFGNFVTPNKLEIFLKSKVMLFGHEWLYFSHFFLKSYHPIPWRDSILPPIATVSSVAGRDDTTLPGHFSCF
jgi:hypothetical protein